MKKLNCILFIDDDEDDNFFHGKVVKDSGVTEFIQVTENAFQALDYIKSCSTMPDLIFLDINMPKMNGWEFIEAYRELRKHSPDTKIVMLTTSLNPADHQKAQTVTEISDFRTKPLNATMFADILQKHFNYENRSGA